MSSKFSRRGKLVFCAYIVRKGKVIYPKNAKVFRFWIKGK